MRSEAAPVSQAELGASQNASSQDCDGHARLDTPSALETQAYRATYPSVDRRSFTRGEVFFDVGAHVGWMSMVAARITGHAGHVVAFEPSPSNLEFLSFHKRKNRLSQIELVPKAVSNKDEARTPFYLVDDGDSFMNSLLGKEIPEIPPQDKFVIEIETITLDTYSNQSGLIPHLIKIDVEGAELWVCEGAKHLLGHHHPALILATHPLWLPEGQKVEDLLKLLEDFGYRILDSNIYKYNGADFGDYLCVADCAGFRA